MIDSLSPMLHPFLPKSGGRGLFFYFKKGLTYGNKEQPYGCNFVTSLYMAIDELLTCESELVVNATKQHGMTKTAER